MTCNQNKEKAFLSWTLILQGTWGKGTLMEFQKNALRDACCWRFHREATENPKGLTVTTIAKLTGNLVDLGARGIGPMCGRKTYVDLYLYTVNAQK